LVFLDIHTAFTLSFATLPWDLPRNWASLLNLLTAGHQTFLNGRWNQQFLGDSWEYQWEYGTYHGDVLFFVFFLEYQWDISAE
jgi:hypothetical protein